MGTMWRESYQLFNVCRQCNAALPFIYLAVSCTAIIELNNEFFYCFHTSGSCCYQLETMLGVTKPSSESMAWEPFMKRTWLLPQKLLRRRSQNFQSSFQDPTRLRPRRRACTPQSWICQSYTNSIRAQLCKFSLLFSAEEVADHWGSSDQCPASSTTIAQTCSHHSESGFYWPQLSEVEN